MKKDSRINASTTNSRNYVTLYFLIALLCGVHTAIIILQNTNKGLTISYRIITQLTFISVISISILIVFDYFHKRFFSKPVRLLGNAARRVANGDFTVQIPPQRKDGKMDEFEVIYADFNTMVAQLAGNEMLKKDFISNVSHELKTPLAVIQGYATTLQSDILTDAERREYADKIVDASKRLTVLVSNILQMSRLENQKIQPKCKPFNLSEQIARCALGFETVWSEKNISVSFHLDQDITLNTDEELLDIVWNNLISNALKFTEPGGSVEVSARTSNGRVCVCVKDSGCGISPDAVSHIFDKFYQEDTSHATEGNGLGLALIKQICVLLGFTIAVDSTPGIGTQFTVTMREHSK